MTFHSGQKVECVDASPDDFGNPINVKAGDRYTIDRVTECGGGSSCCGFFLIGVAPHLGRWPICSLRFRPLVDKKTDIGFAHQILRDLSKTKETAA